MLLWFSSLKLEIFRPKDDEFLTEIPEADEEEEEKRLELIKKKIEAYYQEDDDDDFYDRTKKSK